MLKAILCPHHFLVVSLRISDSCSLDICLVWHRFLSRRFTTETFYAMHQNTLPKKLGLLQGTINPWFRDILVGGSSWNLFQWLISLWLICKPPKDRVVGPLPNGQTPWLTKGVFLITYKSWDDPPSRLYVFFLEGVAVCCGGHPSNFPWNSITNSGISHFW